MKEKQVTPQHIISEYEMIGIAMCKMTDHAGIRADICCGCYFFIKSKFSYRLKGVKIAANGLKSSFYGGHLKRV